MARQLIIEHKLTPAERDTLEAAHAAIWSILSVRESRPPIQLDIAGDVLTVSGVVMTETVRRQVLYAAATTPGVARVIDMLWDDQDIRLRVARELAAAPDLQDPPASIITTSYHGVVTLAGHIHSEGQREQALAVAAGVPGVRGVMDRLSVPSASA